MCMRSLEEAYNDINKQIKDYNSEKARFQRAKEKLLTGKSENKPFVISLNTQSKVRLISRKFDDYKEYRYNLIIPAISCTAYPSIGIDSLIMKHEKFCDIQKVLSSHLDIAKKTYNIAYEIGNLTISYYIFNDRRFYLSGYVGDELVFIFMLRNCTKLSNKSVDSENIFFDGNNMIIIPFNTGYNNIKLKLNIENYEMVSF